MVIELSTNEALLMYELLDREDSKLRGLYQRYREQPELTAPVEIVHRQVLCLMRKVYIPGVVS